MIPGLDKFAAEYVPDRALGRDGYLSLKGLVALPKAELETVRKPVIGAMSMTDQGLTIHQAATVLPVQIYLWSDLPEPAFQAKTAAAIIVLLCFLFVRNGLAIWMRRKFGRRW